jgi:bifunctional ADP-heptose synthase (sugar kinase/adenylyltransferase)
MQKKDQLVNKIKGLALHCQVIIFEDYDKGVISKELIEEVVGFCPAAPHPYSSRPQKT